MRAARNLKTLEYLASSLRLVEVWPGLRFVLTRPPGHAASLDLPLLWEQAPEKGFQETQSCSSTLSQFAMYRAQTRQVQLVVPQPVKTMLIIHLSLWAAAKDHLSLKTFQLARRAAQM